MHKLFLTVILALLCVSCKSTYDSTALDLFNEQQRVFWVMKENPDLVNKSIEELRLTDWFAEFKEPDRTKYIKGSINLYNNRKDGVE